MGRPPLAVGTHGNVRFSSIPTGYRARTKFRGFDGKVREIERVGKTKAKAERELKQAIHQELQTPSGGDITAKTRFRDVAETWLAWQERRVAAGERAPGTVDNYRSMLKNHVLPAFGELRLSEVNVPRLDKFFPAVQAKSSAAHARTARAVVNGVLRYAVRHGAMTSNPTREIERIEGGTRKKARALTPAERRDWIAQLELDPVAYRHDLPELTRFLMATGVRIGEALALYWEDVDLVAGIVRIDWTVVRVRGEGLRRTDPKSSASERTLGLPTWAVEMLRRRHKTATAEHRPADSPVFPDSLGGLRDPSNTRRMLRSARGSEQFSWVTSHVFRKTAATILDDAKLTARVIADQLGHSKPSMTQDVYMGRTAVSPDAAAALQAAWCETP
jgi:integrase